MRSVSQKKGNVCDSYIIFTLFVWIRQTSYCICSTDMRVVLIFSVNLINGISQNVKRFPSLVQCDYSHLYHRGMGGQPAEVGYCLPVTNGTYLLWDFEALT